MRSRWLFFHYFTVLSIPGRFIPLFYTAHSLTPLQVGYLIAIPSLVSIFSTPFMCNLADRTHREHVTAISYLFSLIIFLLQALAYPPLHILPAQSRFPFLIILRVAFGVFGPPLYALVSAIALAQLRRTHGQKGHENFGTERLWGAVSWALFSFLLGIVLDLPFSNMYIVYLAQLCAGVVFVVSVLVFVRTEQAQRNNIPHHSRRHLLQHSEPGQHGQDFSYHSVDVDDMPPSLSPSAALSHVFGRQPLLNLLFLILLFLLSAAMSLVERLLFLFMRHDLHATYFVCGLSVAITVMFEIPLFAITPALLRSLGAPKLLVLGCAAYIVRAYAYTVVPNAWAILLFEPLHGVTFAAAHTAAVAFVAERVPDSLAATGQALMDVLQEVGYAGGTAVGGYVLEVYGPKILYRGAAVCLLLAAIAFYGAEILLRSA